MTVPPSTPSPPPPPPPDIGAGVEPTDAELVGRCRAGDAAAWEVIVRRHGRLATTIARRRGLDGDGADDVFQEVFLALVRGLDAMQNPQGLARWIITTADRIAARHVRDARRRSAAGTPPETVADPAHAAGAGGSAVLDDLEALEESHRLRLALEGLGERCRTLLQALYAGGAAPAYDHVAEQLGIPRGSIGPTRARCLSRLLEQLEHLGADGLAREEKSR